MRKWIIGSVLVVVVVAAVLGFFYSGLWFTLWGIEGIKTKKRTDALDAARSRAPYLTDFARLFPGAEVRYGYFGPGNDPGYVASADLYGRYELDLHVPAQFDASHRNVIGFGEPDFYLVEVEPRTGRGQNFTVADDLHFGAEEWRKIVAAGGDFNAIGYSMKKDQPVPGFSERNKETNE